VPFKRRTAANGKCRAATKAGRQCAAPVIRGAVYCALHSDPKKAAELGRKGGKANRHTFETPSQEVEPPESVGDVKRMLAQTMANVLAGKIDPKLGTTVAYMGRMGQIPPSQPRGPASTLRCSLEPTAMPELPRPTIRTKFGLLAPSWHPHHLRRRQKARLFDTNKRKISRSLTMSRTPAGILGAEATRPATVCSTALGEIYHSICPLLPERIRSAQCAEFEVCPVSKRLRAMPLMRS
jgi:hypothetical protein